MPAIRRWLFLGLIVIGSQIAAGCCYNRPVLFPRLQPCVGGCGPLFPRLSAATSALTSAPVVSGPVASGPTVSGPVYDAPVYGGYSGPIYGGPSYGAAAPCTSCGGHDVGYGVPIAGTPPVMYGPGPGVYGPGWPVAPSPNFAPNFSVPMAMPGAAAPVGNGIPFDSALAPTVKPPTSAGMVGPPDSKKVMLTAGK